MKEFAKYLLWTLGMGVVLYTGYLIHDHQQERVIVEGNPFVLWQFTIFFPVLIGMLLGLPKLIRNFQSRERWRVHWGKLLGAGLPAFLIIAVQLAGFLPLPVSLPFYMEIIMLMEAQITTMIHLIFGYIIVGSFYKRPAKLSF